MPTGDQAMNSSKPYLLRALYEWIADNGLTPHIIVDAEAANIDFPGQAVQDGRLVLNISPMATRELNMTNEAVSFQARFGGAPRDILLPIDTVLAIYARENGQGMMFADTGETGQESGEESDPGGKPDGPTLRVIK